MLNFIIRFYTNKGQQKISTREKQIKSIHLFYNKISSVFESLTQVKRKYWFFKKRLEEPKVFQVKLTSVNY